MLNYIILRKKYEEAKRLIRSKERESKHSPSQLLPFKTLFLFILLNTKCHHLLLLLLLLLLHTYTDSVSRNTLPPPLLSLIHTLSLYLSVFLFQLLCVYAIW